MGASVSTEKAYNLEVTHHLVDPSRVQGDLPEDTHVVDVTVYDPKKGPQAVEIHIVRQDAEEYAETVPQVRMKLTDLVMPSETSVLLVSGPIADPIEKTFTCTLAVVQQGDANSCLIYYCSMDFGTSELLLPKYRLESLVPPDLDDKALKKVLEWLQVNLALSTLRRRGERKVAIMKAKKVAAVGLAAVAGTSVGLLAKRWRQGRQQSLDKRISAPPEDVNVVGAGQVPFEATRP